jgi:hypothetical protein
MQAERVYPFVQRSSLPGGISGAGAGVVLAVVAVAILAIVAFGGIHVAGGIDVGRDDRGRFRSKRVTE